MMAPQPTFYLVCLHENCTQEAAEFIVECLTKSEKDGGAGLMVEQEPMKEKSGGLVLHVTTTNDRINAIAAQMQMKKFDHEGVVRNFEVTNSHNFPPTGYMATPFTLGEIQKCILYAMEFVHFDKDDSCLPGQPEVKIMKGAPVLGKNSINFLLLR